MMNDLLNDKQVHQIVFSTSKYSFIYQAKLTFMSIFDLFHYVLLLCKIYNDIVKVNWVSKTYQKMHINVLLQRPFLVRSAIFKSCCFFC